MSSVCVVSSDNFLVLQPLGKKYDTPEDIAAAVEFIRDTDLASVPLEGIVLHGNSYSSLCIDELVRTLTKDRPQDFLANIRYLDFSDMFTGRLKDDVPKSLATLGSLIAKCPSLRFLNLSDNAFGPAGAEAIAPHLSNLRLHTLMINNNGLGQMGSAAIAAAIKDIVCLETLSIGRNRLEDPGAIAIAETIKGLLSLKQFSAYQNGITKKGIVSLCSSLASCMELEILDLQDNTFTYDGAAIFARLVVPVLPFKLRVLNLNDCLLTRRGSRAILDAMNRQPPSRLVVLGLQYNGITDSELPLLIQLVAQMPHLQSLQLNGNAFDPDEPPCIQLREALERLDQEDVLDSLSDMESPDESEEEVDEEGPAPPEKDESASTLAELLKQTHVQ